MFDPKDLVPDTNARTWPQLQAEVRRLHLVVWELVRNEPRARFRRWAHVNENGDTIPTEMVEGKFAKNPPTLILRRSYTASFTGHAQFNEIVLRFGPWADWACILESMIHEMCHIFCPNERRGKRSFGHTQAFWNLLCDAMRTAFGVDDVDPTERKGQLYGRDLELEKSLRRLAPAWGSIRPLDTDPEWRGKVMENEVARRVHAMGTKCMTPEGRSLLRRIAKNTTPGARVYFPLPVTDGLARRPQTLFITARVPGASHAA